MITFPCTKRVVERFRFQPVEDAPASTGVLGDWYANLLNVGSQRLVLCASAPTLLPVILPARRECFHRGLANSRALFWSIWKSQDP